MSGKSTDDRSLSVALPTSTFLPDLGGAAVGLHNIATGLAARGHRPRVIAPYRLVRRLAIENLHLSYAVTALPPRADWLMRRSHRLGFAVMDRYFEWLQQRNDFDVWHGTIGFPVGVCLAHFADRRRRKKVAPLPHLVRCAGDDVQCLPEIGYGMRLDPDVDRCIRDWLPRADRLVAITESMADEYAALGVVAEQILRIPNGVDVPRFAAPVDRAAVRARLGAPEDAFLFLAVGRNHPKKNFAAILRALAAIEQPTDRAAWVLLVGDRVDQLTALALELGISDRVLLRPPIRPDKHAQDPNALPAQALVDIYKASDAFVFPSRVESFGIVLAEALAAGLPVIAGDAPGCRDVLGNGEHGLLIPPDDVAGLARAMSGLIADDTLRRDLAARSLRRAGDFAWDKVVDRYVEAYRDAIDRADTALKRRLGSALHGAQN